MKTIYRVVVEKDLSQDEEDLVIAEADASIGDLISMGDNKRKWQVIRTEAYTGENEDICLALVALQDKPVPVDAMWTHNVIRESDPLGLHVMFGNSQQILATGVTLNDKPPIYPLMTEKQTWLVDHVETYLPQSQSSYNQVHLCYCIHAKQPVVA